LRSFVHLFASMLVSVDPSTFPAQNFGLFRIGPGSKFGPKFQGSEHRIMGKKLYVGNLSYSVDKAALEELLAAFGQVQSAEVIMDRETGRSKGFGFVEMSSDDEAQAAIAGLSGKEHGGRALTVNEAKPREPRSGGFGGGGGGGGGGYGGGGGGGGRKRY
jgi:cold-inducible RNA-binding protein